jgi:UDP-N-acetylmuramoyl-L-alanyl-D-glutamate--2,6-diaminopimelate ligase
MLARLVAELQRPVARTSTLGSYLDERRVEHPLNAAGFLATMRECLDLGGRFAVLEMTSETLARGLAQAWPCELAVFTNLSHDHLDAHESAEHYLASKAQLFLHLQAGGMAVLNANDPASELIASVVPNSVQTLWYGLDSDRECAVAGKLVAVSTEGTRVELGGSLFPEGGTLELAAIGEVFAQDALAALCAARALGLPGPEALAALAKCPAPPGRFEVVAEEPLTVVDFAHTPDAVRRTVECGLALTSGELWAVLGAGGERDRDKRPLMGQAVAAAHHVVLTSDNPRGEDPAVIAGAIGDGLGMHRGIEVELDRRAAIELAIARAQPEDVVLILGRGHEATQEVAGVKTPFSDVEVARASHALHRR